MKITEREMRGLLTGKCLPGDMRLNEDLPAYLLRKFDELQQKLDALEDKLRIKQNHIRLRDSYIEELEAREPVVDTDYLNSVRAEAVSNFWNSSLRDVAHVLYDIRAFDDSSEAAGIVHSEIKERVEDFVAHLRSGTHDTADKAG